MKSRVITLAIWLLAAAGIWAVNLWPASGQAGCPQSLQSLIDGAASGSTVTVPACIYRETANVTKPLTLDGKGAAEVRGSDVWASWTQTGATWVSANAVPDLGTDTTGVFNPNDQFRAQHLEQVFIDRAALVQVPSNPVAGQFSLDSTRHVIIPSNPSGHTVEVTTRQTWFLTQADNVTITGFTFHDAATGGQMWALGNNNHSNFTVSNDVIADAHGSALAVGAGPSHGGAHITGNTFTRNGDEAIQSYLDDATVLSGNTFSLNGFGGWLPDWSAGGAKFANATHLTIDSNYFIGNGGPGIWCDIHCDSVVISNNHLKNNTAAQIHYEISSNAAIYGNVVEDDSIDADFAGIQVASSTGVEVYGNLVHNTVGGRGINVVEQDRTDKPTGSGTATNVHDNNVIQEVDGHFGLVWWDYGSGVITAAASNNHAANNQFWYPAPEGQGRWQETNTIYSRIADFAATSLGAGSAYMSDTQKASLLSGAVGGAGTPVATSTPTPAATLLPTATAGTTSTPVVIQTSTLVPSTATPVRPTPTSTKPPVLTATPVRTATATTAPATATPVPTVATCAVYTRQNGRYVWVNKPAAFCQPSS